MHGNATGIRALATGVGTDAAMFVVLRVLAAFLCTTIAGVSAEIDGLTQHFFVRTRASRRHCSGRSADVRAIEIESNALSKLFDHGFAKTCIRARHT